MWAGILRVYHGGERVAEIIPSAEQVTPSGKVWGKSYARWIKEAGFAQEEAGEGAASFKVGKHRVEIDSRLVEVEGIWSIFRAPLNIIGYAQCEIVVRVDGIPVFKRRFC
jgi:hypothetical protein